MDRHGGPPPGIDGCRESQIRQGEDGAAMNKTEAVSVMIPELEAGRCPAVSRLQKFDANEFRKEVFAEK
jgi:hypothetical protein